MRDIKFRAWDNFNEVMTYPDKNYPLSRYSIEFNWKNNNKISLMILIDPRCGEMREFDADIMQYIGLKDINGKEIYEGDIVRVESHNSEFRNMIGQVMYSEIDASYWVIEGTKENHFGSTISTEYNEYEVIGNIYENKDLLGA